MRIALLTTTFVTLTLSAPLMADDITPRLQAAMDAQTAGDLKTVAAELAALEAAVNAERGRRLEALLPATPDGMTRTITPDHVANMAMMGGGTGAEASYATADGSYVTVTYNLDSPLITALMPAMMAPETRAMLGQPVELNGLTFLDQGNSMTAIIDERLLATVTGDDPALLRTLAEAIDGAALASFDQP
jgi:hypothetical protein